MVLSHFLWKTRTILHQYQIHCIQARIQGGGRGQYSHLNLSGGGGLYLYSSKAIA